MVSALSYFAIRIRRKTLRTTFFIRTTPTTNSLPTAPAIYIYIYEGGGGIFSLLLHTRVFYRTNEKSLKFEIEDGNRTYKK